MMHKFVPIIVLFLSCSTLADRAERAQKTDQVFQTDRLLTLRIHMSAERWRMMQPTQASRLATAMAVVQHPTTPKSLDIAKRTNSNNSISPTPIDGARRPPGLVSNEYAYVSATVKIDDKTYQEVGIRFKGQWSYALAGASPRRPLKIDFNHFVRGQHFHGIESLSLNTNALDPSQLRESLGYAFFRDAGIPAPRTCLALVYLTVDGLYDNELLGLYTGIEEVNKDFLYRHFGTTKGLLIRPERTRNLAYFGNRWQDYNRYNLQSDATPFTAARFMDFTRIIQVASDEYFCSEIAPCLDADEFLRFLAANVLMVNLDGVLVNGHNFYVYIHPTTGRITFIPWDLHLGFGWNGRTLEEWVSLTIERPYRNGNRLLDRVMMVGWMRETYHHYLREFATTCFAPDKMHARIDQLEQVVHKAEAIAQSDGKKLPVSMPANASQPRAELKPFVTGRVQSVLDQLAGRAMGDPITGRPAKPPPRPAPKAKRQVVTAQPVPKAQAAPTTRPLAVSTPAPKPIPATRPAGTPTAPPKVPAPPPPPRPTPPPINPFANFVLNNIDADRDGQVTRDELADAAKHLFIAHSWVQPGDVDEASLAATLDYIGRLLDPFPASNDDASPPADPLRPRSALTWAAAILQQTNTRKNQHATLADLLAAANRQFDSADTNRNGSLDLREVSGQMDQIVSNSQSTKKP
ncbi:MAG: CotH kinase family protein [Planctomycetota bacterium]|nr:CotH kinase family protein [Planctomycetota bacterium]